MYSFSLDIGLKMADTSIEVHPPDSFLKYEPPVFVGMEPSKGHVKSLATHKGKDSTASQMDEMVNSMLPPR